MDLFNDFGNQNKDFFQTTLSNVFQTFATDTLQRNGLIKTGPTPMGNPTAGQYGAPPPAPAANTSGLNRSMGFGGFGGMDNTTMMIAGGLILVVVLVVTLK